MKLDAKILLIIGLVSSLGLNIAGGVLLNQQYNTYEYTKANVVRSYALGCALGYSTATDKIGDMESICNRFSEKFGEALSVSIKTLNGDSK